jgi:hypothetical protein
MMEWVWAVLVGVAGFAAIWFGGRTSAQNDTKEKQAEARRETATKAQEIENEVEALDRDALKSRARRWVRGTGRQ